MNAGVPAPVLRARALALAALLGMAASAGAAAAQERGTVSGTVLGTFQAQSRPLPHAVVEAWGPGYRRSVMADSVGRYRLDGVPGAPLRLRVSHPGHDPVTLDVMVPASAPFVVDVELDARPVEMAPVSVTARPGAPDVERRDLDVHPESRLALAALEIGTGVVDAGLADAVRAFGGNDPAQATDVLFMRGSTTDLKLVLLDGAPVYTPFHVAGLLKSFEPDVLGRADLHVGGAPARYDGGLTYILDLRTRRPRRDGLHVSGSVDLLSASTALDAPLGSRAGLVASARSLHGLGSAPLGASPYGYRDVLVGVEAEPAAGHLVRTTAFWNRESVVLDFPEAMGIAASRAPDQAWWSNRALAATWLGRAGDVLLEATVAGAEYEATLPLQAPGARDDAAAAPVLASAETRRLRAGVEAARATERGMVRAGLSLEGLDAGYAADPLASSTRPARAASTSRTMGAYVDVSRTLAPEVSIRAGLRSDHFSGHGAPRLAPRVAVSWEVGPQVMATVAAGRYHQTARANDLTLQESLTHTARDTAAAGSLMPVATADHVVVSLDQRIGERVRLGVAGFWKGYRGLRADPEETILSSGVDLRIQRRSEEFTAWLGYGLSWYWSGSDLSGSSTDFTGRQLLTAGLSGSLGERLGAELQVAYGAGLPYTSVPLRPVSSEADSRNELTAAGPVLEQAPPLPGGVDEEFLRVDVQVHASFRPTWRGRTWEIQPYLRVLNALDRRDALFYAFQPWRDEGLTPLARRPLVPVVGLAWRF